MTRFMCEEDFKVTKLLLQNAHKPYIYALYDASDREVYYSCQESILAMQMWF